MGKGQSYEQLVGSYLDNEMSEKQRTDFENQLQSNPELKQELQFQQEIMNGVRNFRRLELKARLDNIPVYTPVYQTIAFKAVAAVAITAGIGFGGYYLLNRGNESALEKVELTFNDSTLAEIEEVIPALPQANPTDDSSINAGLTGAETSNIADGKTRKTSKKEKSTNAVTTTKPNVTTPKVETFSDDEFESEEIGALNPQSNETIAEPLSEAIEVATVKDKKNKFHYKFYENKLYLLGTFDDMPYEIIEINSKSGKKFYLYYKENFYRLQNDQVKPTPLERIENDSLVNELKIIQMNKSQ
jgi:hypothetical protein